MVFLGLEHLARSVQVCTLGGVSLRWKNKKTVISWEDCQGSDQAWAKAAAQLGFWPKDIVTREQTGPERWVVTTVKGCRWLVFKDPLHDPWLDYALPYVLKRLAA